MSEFREPVDKGPQIKVKQHPGKNREEFEQKRKEESKKMLEQRNKEKEVFGKERRKKKKSGKK